MTHQNSMLSSHHPSQSASWSILEFTKQLVIRPEKILEAIRLGTLKDSELLLKALMYLLMASFGFALLSVIRYPSQWHLSSAQLTIRFFSTFALMLLLLIPGTTLVWSLLQKTASWFFNVRIPYQTILANAGVGIAYYALIFMVGIPLIFFKPFAPMLIEFLLFALNIWAFIASIRLFQMTYSVLGDLSRRKSLWIATSPILIVIGLYVVLQVMVYFAMHPHYKHG